MLNFLFLSQLNNLLPRTRTPAPSHRQYFGKVTRQVSLNSIKHSYFQCNIAELSVIRFPHFYKCEHLQDSCQVASCCTVNSCCIKYFKINVPHFQLLLAIYCITVILIYLTLQFNIHSFIYRVPSVILRRMNEK